MSEYKELSGAEGLKKIGDLIKDIRIAMLTTAAPDGSFDSRPMATQKVEEFRRDCLVPDAGRVGQGGRN